MPAGGGGAGEEGGVMAALPPSGALTDFDISQKIGEGGFSVVYSARQRSTGARVALKVIQAAKLSAEERARVDREILIHASASRVPSPHVVQLRSWFCDAERVYIVLELCPNGDLYKLKKRYGFCSEPVTRDLGRQLLLGLGFLHDRGIVHRDLKLSNLLIGTDGRLKIADFGLAARLELPGDEQFTLCGTPNYIAPEIVDVDKRHAHSLPVDLWSVGCLLHMLLTGEAPFPDGPLHQQQHHQHEQQKQQQQQQPAAAVLEQSWRAPAGTTLSREAVAILEKLLRRDPSARLTVAAALEQPFFSPSPAAAAAAAAAAARRQGHP